MTSDRTKLVTLELVSKIGVGGNDHLRLTLKGLPIEEGKELALNLKPGLGGLELLTTSLTGTATVSVDALVDGRKIVREFEIPANGGVRLKPSQLLTDDFLNVSRIETLFGPVVATELIRATP
jgi:hypothetical protein